ncbi:MAG TPA: exodeoxyribonuclease VII small subunit [Phycisphaerales bacterium]|nr:exodeoxyribonuclease VII small subunit [Phycisphaerales bacterium]
MAKSERGLKGTDAAGDVAELSFEDAVRRLEEITEKIESGEIGLEQSLTEYERGMALLKHCRGILDRAEQRVAELTPGDEGSGRGRRARGGKDDVGSG